MATETTGSTIIAAMNNQLGNCVMDSDKITSLQTYIEQLAALFDRTHMSDKGRQETPKKLPLAKARGIDKVPTFSGIRGEFLNWARRVEVFCEDDMTLKELLKKIKLSDVPIDQELQDQLPGHFKSTPEDIKWYKYQLHILLMTLTTDTPHSLVDTMPDEYGFEAWRQFHFEIASTTAQRKRALLGRVLQHPKAKGYEDLLSVQAEWEKAVIKYKDATGDVLNKEIFATAYINILPEKVAENMRTLKEELNTVDDLKLYVRKQVNAHVNPISETKPVPMDIGHVQVGQGTEPAKETQENCRGDHQHQQEQVQEDMGLEEIMSLYYSGGFKGKGGKGKGSGGKGGFSGKCDFCGEHGHMKREWRKLDKIMEERRAKGLGKAQRG